MSSGTYCVIRDLGLVKGGKGMRHHEVLATLSVRALWRAIASAAKPATPAAGVQPPTSQPMSDNRSLLTG